MAAEYHARRYLFWPKASSTESQSAPPKFVFNYYHDLESVFWAFLYYLFTHVSLWNTQGTPETLNALKCEQLQYFGVGCAKSSHRQNAITSAPHPNWFEFLKDQGLHASVLEHLSAPLQLDCCLREAYQILESDTPLDSTHWDDECFSVDVYNMFVDAFQDTLDGFSDTSTERMQATHVNGVSCVSAER